MREIIVKLDNYALKAAAIDAREMTHEAVCAERYGMILNKVRWLSWAVLFLSGVELFGGHKMIEAIFAHFGALP